MGKVLIFIATILIGFSSLGHASDLPNGIFFTAKELAFAGKRKEAKAMCVQILSKDTNDFETRILLGRLHAWDKDYDKARNELDVVLAAQPKNADARSALVDVELWSDHPSVALKLANSGLRFNRESESLLFGKAKALRAIGRLDDAAATAERVVALNPNNAEAQVFLADIASAGALYKATLDYTHDVFDESTSAWNLLVIGLNRTFGFGSLIGRVSYANRFDKPGIQFEADAYPKIGAGTYAYLNYGYSRSLIFPRHRFGGEIYQTLPPGWELSAGIRRLWFSSSQVNAFTGSFSKYLGNFYFSVGPSITPGAIGTSYSGNVLVRHYFGDENYMTLTFGLGSSAGERVFTEEVFRLGAKRVGLDGRMQLATSLFITAGVGFEHEEIRPEAYRERVSLSMGLEQRF